MSRCWWSVESFALDFKRDFGIKHRTGWSVHLDGVVYASFEPGPVRAIVKAFLKRRRCYLADTRSEKAGAKARANP